MRDWAAGFVGLVLVACASDPNMPDQDVVHSVGGRDLTVGYVPGQYDPVVVALDDGTEISPFPLVGSDGVLVQDLGDQPLTEDDEALARMAAQIHCRAFRRRLSADAAVFQPAGAGFLFGRCEP